MRYPRCNIALKIVSRIAAPTKRSHALRETLRACISSVALADIGGDFSLSRLRSRMARGSNLNTLDIRFSVMLPAGLHRVFQFSRRSPSVDANPAAESSQVVGG
jgi:hypothetical protein